MSGLLLETPGDRPDGLGEIAGNGHPDLVRRSWPGGDQAKQQRKQANGTCPNGQFHVVPRISLEYGH